MPYYGIRKAGTRALITFLNLHPQIQTAKNEVHFFDDKETFDNGMEWYRKRMPYSFTGQITLEKTPGYFKTREAPERVYKMNATVKILLIVRDPTERGSLRLSTNAFKAVVRKETFSEL